MSFTVWRVFAKNYSNNLTQIVILNLIKTNAFILEPHANSNTVKRLPFSVG